MWKETNGDLRMMHVCQVFIMVLIQGACLPSFHHWTNYFSLLFYFFLFFLDFFDFLRFLDSKGMKMDKDRDVDKGI